MSELGRTRSVALSGLEGSVVEVEAHVTAGLPHFAVTGLPDKACATAPDRVRSAAATSGNGLPSRRIMVNLAPASVPKHGTGFDLPIAVAVLAAAGVVRASSAAEVVHLGELGFDGRVLPVPGVLAAVLVAARAGARHVVVPPENVPEAQLVDGVVVHAPPDLATLVAWYAAAGRRGGPGALPAAPRVAPPLEPAGPGMDLADVVGQPEARLALELAATGGHHLLFNGPPGVGKTMLAERLVTILPRLTRAQALETHAVRSLWGVATQSSELDLTPPFVAPHHSASPAAVVGGGTSRILPGAVSRAHHGVLFLDEAPEFKASVLQTLRQPLESGEVVILRAHSAVRYPARFLLALAANPCPCGRGWGKGAGCSCTAQELRSYANRLSGPLLDRVDIQLVVPPVRRAAFADERGEASAVVAARVAAARAVQAERWAPLGWATNGEARGHVLRRRPWRLTGSVTAAVDRSLDRGTLTLRGYDRVLRLTCTIQSPMWRIVQASTSGFPRTVLGSVLG
ncbi:MAG TPA: YifB family Mg chelatase-like AAA ATPase [Dermatophilaceae bacterium]|nr:YifB family Mg chelatase-like AAA ATPase [Dermatophilaceae bacterium]